MIQLDEAAIERALPLVEAGLAKYGRLQAALATTDVTRDREFQMRFNGFYRVRRDSAWQSAFFSLLKQNKSKRQSFADVLRALHAATGRVEASFASKLVASIDPDMPVIDKFVLENLGLRLPPTGPIEIRLGRIVELHHRIRGIYSDYLDSDMGQHLVDRFKESYPGRHVSRVKMLDLILWQVRSPLPNKPGRRGNKSRFISCGHDIRLVQTLPVGEIIPIDKEGDEEGQGS